MTEWMDVTLRDDWMGGLHYAQATPTRIKEKSGTINNRSLLMT